jgi:hypothetical protein
MKYRTKDSIAEKDVLNNSGHNCLECQPFIKGEKVFKGCLEGCRPDWKFRFGDAFHESGCPNGEHLMRTDAKILMTREEAENLKTS